MTNLSDLSEDLNDHLPKARVRWQDVPVGVRVSRFIGGGRTAHVAVMPDGPATVTFEEGEGDDAYKAMEQRRVESIVPDWSCKRWGQHEHDWLSCPQCQIVYKVHIEAEQRGEPGVLHWFSEKLREATACGSRSDATTDLINGPTGMADVSKAINGKVYLVPRVTCPLCRDLARDEGVLQEIASSDRSDPQTRESIIDWNKEAGGLIDD